MPKQLLVPIRYNPPMVANGEIAEGDLITYASSHGHVSVATVTEIIHVRDVREDAGPDGFGGRKFRHRSYYKIKVEIRTTSEVDLSQYGFTPLRKNRTLSDLHKIVKLSPTALS